MKKVYNLFLFLIILTSISVFFVLGLSAETVKGHLEYYYNGNKIVNNDWVLDRSSGILTIKSLTTDYNETGTGQSNFSSSWYKYNNEIKKVVLNGTFAKVSNNAFANCKNLKEVEITERVNQMDSNAFMGCSSLETIYIKGSKYIGMADLRNITQLKQGILSGTAIKTVNLSHKISSIHNTALPSGLTHIYGTAGSMAEIYANTNSIPFSELFTNINVNIYIDDYLYKNNKIRSGDKFDEAFFEHNGKIYAIFENKECTKPFDNSKNITDSISLYAKSIFSFNGWSVRVKDYKGLRSIFEYKPLFLKGNIKIIEAGAIVKHHPYALDEVNSEEMAVTKIPVYQNDKLVAKTLGTTENKSILFAVTIVGFEGDADQFAERAIKNTVFRGYITLKNEETGESQTLYTDAVGTTLRNASQQYLKYQPGTQEECEFVRETLELTESHTTEVRYDKEILMDLMRDVYNDCDMILVGEEISPNKTALDVQNSFKSSSGEYPSIIGMDLACYGANLMSCTKSYRTRFIKAAIDYCRAGGVITASSHFQNPTGNWTSKGLCRGYLGKDDMWKDLITEGTALNNQFRKELDVNADFLRDLGNNDVPILWRPFHEMNGGWFWWCITQENGYKVSADSFTNLWKYVYNYYENDLGLTNLVWVYSPNNDTGSLVDVEYSFPGESYVDMTGLDWYSKGNFEIGSNEGAYIRMMNYGMPVAITEYGGSSGNLDSMETWDYIQRMYSEGMRVSYILTWTSQHTFGSAGKAAEFMTMTDTLSRNEVYNLIRAMEIK